jgi:adenine-specific DNA-methyltransferase
VAGPDRNVAGLGQVFTPPPVVEAMLALRRNAGPVLEPAAGDGAFLRRLQGCTAIEIDPRFAPEGAEVRDFFAYPDTHKFASIVGNPPFWLFRIPCPNQLKYKQNKGMQCMKAGRKRRQLSVSSSHIADIRSNR